MSLSPKRISAAEIIRNFGRWQRETQTGPLEITRHGRGRSVLMSVETYGELMADADIRVNRSVAKLAQGQLAVILDHMHEGFVALDKALTVQDLNKVAAAFHGVLQADAPGLPLAMLWPPEKGDNLAEACRRVLRSGETLHLELTAPRTGRWATVTLFPYREGLALLFTNITEQQRLRDCANEWAACAAALSRNPSAGWLKLDRSGRIIQAGVANLFPAFADSCPADMTLFEMIGPADRRTVQQAFEDVIRPAQPVDLDVMLAVQAGRHLRVDLSLSPLMQASAPIGALAVLVASDQAGSASVAA